MAMIKCGHCHKPIDKIVTNCFEHNGSDNEYKFRICCANQIAVIDLPATWCGLELSEDERMEGIRCPHCGQFPFDADGGVEAIIQVTCFTVPGEEDKQC